MFHYTYANSDGIQQTISGKKRADVEQQALDYIRMLSEPPPFISTQINRLALANVTDALNTKDFNKSVTAWNHYAFIVLKQHVAYHDIDPIVMDN